MSNEAIYGLVLAAVIVAILINWKLKINLGLVCLVFAYVIGCIVMGMKGKTVVSFTPVSIVFQLAALTFFFSFPHQNGTLEAIANKLMYRFRNHAWSMPLVLLFIGVLLGVIEILAKAYISTQLSDAIVFAVLIIVLLVKPAGLLGKLVREKV